MTEAIILAGGRGTRLRNLFPQIPKPLVPMGKKVFLEILLSQLAKVPFLSKVILSLGYKAEDFVKFFEERKNVWPFPVAFSFEEEKNPLGTGGALKKAFSLVNTSSAFVLNGDSYLDLNFFSFIKNHEEKKAECSLALTKVKKNDRYGNVRLNLMTQKIVSFSEKTDQEFEEAWINAGIYLIEKKLFEKFSFPQNFSLEKEAFPLFLKKNVNMQGFFCEEAFIDIGTESSYFEAQTFLKHLIEE